jgi:hypothetical protein
LDQGRPLVDLASAQATRRVLQGEVVLAADKLLSLFASHTQAIRHHKPGTLTAFARSVLLDEAAGGSSSHCAILNDVGAEHLHCGARPLARYA